VYDHWCKSRWYAYRLFLAATCLALWVWHPKKLLLVLLQDQLGIFSYPFRMVEEPSLGHKECSSYCAVGIAEHAPDPAFCDVFDIRRLMLNTCKCLCRIPLCHFGGEGVNIFYVTEIFYRKIFSDKMLLRHILRD
jgi:hypothetical protein